MDLRAELKPPPLDVTLVSRLASLADRLDGARPGERDDELAEFNRIANMALGLDAFQGAYGAGSHADWVRGLLHSQRIRPAVGVTHAELIEVVRRAMPTNEYFDEHEAYMVIFDANVPLPNASTLIYYPPDYDARMGTWEGGRSIHEYDPTPAQIVGWALAPSVQPAPLGPRST